MGQFKSNQDQFEDSCSSHVELTALGGCHKPFHMMVAYLSSHPAFCLSSLPTFALGSTADKEQTRQGSSFLPRETARAKSRSTSVSSVTRAAPNPTIFFLSRKPDLLHSGSTWLLHNPVGIIGSPSPIGLLELLSRGDPSQGSKDPRPPELCQSIIVHCRCAWSRSLPSWDPPATLRFNQSISLLSCFLSLLTHLSAFFFFQPAGGVHLGISTLSFASTYLLVFLCWIDSTSRPPPVASAVSIHRRWSFPATFLSTSRVRVCQLDAMRWPSLPFLTIIQQTAFIICEWC